MRPRLCGCRGAGQSSKVRGCGRLVTGNRSSPGRRWTGIVHRSTGRDIRCGGERQGRRMSVSVARVVGAVVAPVSIARTRELPRRRDTGREIAARLPFRRHWCAPQAGLYVLPTVPGPERGGAQPRRRCRLRHGRTEPRPPDARRRRAGPGARTPGCIPSGIRAASRCIRTPASSAAVSSTGTSRSRRPDGSRSGSSHRLPGPAVGVQGTGDVLRCTGVGVATGQAVGGAASGAAPSPAGAGQVARGCGPLRCGQRAGVPAAAATASNRADLAQPGREYRVSEIVDFVVGDCLTSSRPTAARMMRAGTGT